MFVLVADCRVCQLSVSAVDCRFRLSFVVVDCLLSRSVSVVGYHTAKTNTDILKQIFPEKEYRGLSPNFHIDVSVIDLYVPMIGLPILLEEICRPLLGLYKSLTDT